MAAKPRINLRFRGDLWEAINARAKRHKTSATAELEAAAERYLLAEGDLRIVAPVAGEPSRVEANGHGGRVQGSAAVKAGVKPIPKAIPKGKGR